MNSIAIETDEEMVLAFSEFDDDRKRRFEADVQRMLQKYVKAERTAKLKKLINELQQESGEALSADMLMVLIACD